MDEQSCTLEQAQQRADQIQSFQQELALLQNEGIVTLPSDQCSDIQHYHRNLLQRYAADFDIDTNIQSKQLTLGMKIASLLGALAMAISIFFLFYQFWGFISVPVQVTVLITAPVLFLFLSLRLVNRDKNVYFAKIAALISLSCFVLNLSMLGQIFNITPSPNAFLVWAGFAFLLAYACKARLLLFFAICSVSSFIAMKVGSWSGSYWISFGERPENFFIPSMITFIIPQLIDQKRYSGFASTYRVLAMIFVFLPVLILSNWGKVSYLTWQSNIIEGIYQLIGFALSAFAIWVGIKKQWHEVMNTGNVFFILFLYTKFFDWWWDWMPKYIFFFLLGLSALLALLVFRRIRTGKVNEGVMS